MKKTLIIIIISYLICSTVFITLLNEILGLALYFYFGIIGVISYVILIKQNIEEEKRK
ncbi:MAG: hypothetical protein ACOC56_07090 [Atribacterota bacterium]